MLTGPGMRCYVLVAGGTRRARIPRQHSHVHAGCVRRPRRPAAARRRHADRRRRSRARTRLWPGPRRPRRDRRATQHRAPLGDRRDRGTARGTRVLHPRRHRHRSSAPTTPCTSTPTAPGAPRRPEAAVGPHRRRRGRPAPVEHPRQRLLRWRAGLHRRHPDPARPRRTQPRRLRLPGDRGRRRPLEARPDGAGRHRAVRAGARRPRAVAAHHRRRPARVVPVGDLDVERWRRRCAQPSSPPRTAPR